MNVLSLFDGMSCGQQALERTGIKVDKYFASEIDKYAIKVTMANYPDTIQLGSVIDVNGYDLPKIDLLIGGSPCQSFSFAGKRKGMSTKDAQEILTLEHYLQLKSEGFEFEGQSYLFWEYMRLLNELRTKNPNVYFLLENVMMGKKWQSVLTKAIGVEPIMINSSLVSAQNRKRLYWTNIGLASDGLFGDLKSAIEQPKDKGILLKDILQDNPDAKTYLTKKEIEIISNKKHQQDEVNYIDGKARTLVAGSHGNAKHYTKTIIPIDEKYYLSEKMISYFDSNNKKQIENNTGFRFSPNTGDKKSNSITTKEGSRMENNYIVHNFNNKRLNETIDKHKDSLEDGTMIDSYNQTIHKDKSITISTRVNASNCTHIVAMRGCPNEDGENKQQLEPREDGKTNCLTSVNKDNLVQLLDCYNNNLRTDGKIGTITQHMSRSGMTNGFKIIKNSRIRRLTPIECERLQTVPDNYTNHVSDSQRYKMLGNGWTVDVIAHIFSYLK